MDEFRRRAERDWNNGTDPRAARSSLKAVNILDPISLQGKPVPVRSWIVESWIPDRNVTSLGGDGGTGKTLLGQQLITAAATGKPWLGHPVKRCRTLAVFCEDDADELHMRQDSINRHYDIGFGDLEDVKWMPVVEQNNALATFPEFGAIEPSAMYLQIQRVALEFGAEIILLDSLHDLYLGNENHRGQVRQFVSLLRSLAIEIGGAVVLTMHPSLSGLSSGSGMSGSTGWNNAVRSRLYLYRDDDDADQDHRTLARRKANYARAEDQMIVRYSDGVFVRDDEPSGIVGAIHQRNAETVFLEALDTLAKQGVEVSEIRQGQYAPKVMARMPQTNGYKQNQLDRAMVSLFGSGQIELEHYGPPSRRRRRIIRSKSLPSTPVSP